MRSSSELILHELIERIVRFHQHLKKVEEEFFNEKRKTIEKITFLGSYVDCLNKILEVALVSFYSENAEKEKLDTLNECIKRVRDLHRTKLSHLPRPSEPNELKRFNRIINIQVSAFTRQSDDTLMNDRAISIYMTEDIGEETFFKDPLHEFKVTKINELVAKVSDQNVQGYSTEVQSDSIHITIPRIDAFNPCRWPTLIHELGHHLMKSEYFPKGDIMLHFEEKLESENNKAFIKALSDTLSIKQWLTECWCDLFAATLMGPSLWYSQFSAFIFSGEYMYTDRRPFPAFRLLLIYKILEKRLDNTLTSQTKESILEYTKLIDQLDKNFDEQKFLQLLHLFQNYFTQYFFTKDKDKLVLGPDSFNDSIQPLLKYTLSIKEETINDLITDLNNRLPIPSKREEPNEITETFNSVQEIIQSAWIFRSNHLTKELSQTIDGFKSRGISNNIELILEGLLSEYKKFDESILKSIQVTEWFSLLVENFDRSKRDTHIKNIQRSSTGPFSSQLVDYEIYQAIKDKTLRIIPLIDPKQIGTTSVDIRLGTSFQYYYPNQYGILDFTDDESIQSTEASTKSIDLDFLDSITLAPGQFLLGHSMEYVLLHDTLSADLDGRSSFARSGLEIHMTAGFVEPGFRGVLTFEFYNAGANPIKLYPGMRIGQLRFIPVNEPAEAYEKKREAKYKGLLTHYRGLQSKDDEVQIIKAELMKNDLKQFAKKISREEIIKLIDVIYK